MIDHAQAKLARKGCDLLVVNDVGGGAVFGCEDNEAVVLAADGERRRRAARLQGRAGPRRLGPRRVLRRRSGPSRHRLRHVYVPQDGQLGSAAATRTHHLWPTNAGEIT